MIPISDCEITYGHLDRELWVPDDEDLASDEGFGPYRETWVMSGCGLQSAVDALDFERAVITAVGPIANTAHEFDLLLDAVQWDELDVEDEPVAPAALTSISQWLSTHDEGRDGIPTGALDIGVAGLVFALSAFGCHPVVSCRGHPDGWSEFPMVQFATDLRRARVVAELARRAGCGLIREDRFLTTWARSVSETMELGLLIAENVDAFTAT